MSIQLKNSITFACIGIVAYIFADVIHEVIGHGITALLTGNHITLVSSVYFRSRPGNTATDLGGPVANLCAGLILYRVLKRKQPFSVITVLLLVHLMAYNLFWFSGTILQSAFSQAGDWTFTVGKITGAKTSTIILSVAGVAAYYFSARLVRIAIQDFHHHFPGVPVKAGVYIPYFAAAITAVVAGLLYAPAREAAAVEGLLEMIASLPVLLIASAYTAGKGERSLPVNSVLYVATGILFIVFCCTLGRGIGAS